VIYKLEPNYTSGKDIVSIFLSSCGPVLNVLGSKWYKHTSAFLHKTDEGLFELYVSSGVASDVVKLADLYNCSVKRVSTLGFNPKCIARCRIQKSSVESFITRDNPNLISSPKIISENLFNSMGKGDTLGISIRGATFFEKDNVASFINSQIRQEVENSARKSNALISFFAMSKNYTSAKSLGDTFMGSIENFVSNTKTWGIRKARANLGLLLSVLLPIFLSQKLPLSYKVFSWDLSNLAVYTKSGLIIFAFAMGLVALCNLSGIFPIPIFAFYRMRYFLKKGFLPPPKFRVLPYKKPVSVWKQDNPSVDTSKVSNSYPLDLSSFKIGPAQVLSLFYPIGKSEAVGQKNSPISPELSSGGLIGTSIDEKEDVRIPSGIREKNIFIVGNKGSGKTVLLQSLYGADEYKKSEKNKNFCSIVFENKGEGINEYLSLSKEFNPSNKPIVLDLSSTSAKFNFFDAPSPLERGAQFSSFLKATFEEGSIQAHSQKVLSNLFSAADVFVNTKEGKKFLELSGLNEYFGNKNVIELLDMFLTDDKTNELFSSLTDVVLSNSREGIKNELNVARSEMEMYFGMGLDAKGRRQSFLAPQNKVEVLMRFKHLFNPTSVGFKQVLESGKTLLINLGTSNLAKVDRKVEIDDISASTIGSILFLSLTDAIKKTCNSWASENKFVYIYADELKLLSANNNEKIEWLNDAGRSYGVVCNFATQRFEQLVPAVQSSLKTFGTVISFVISEPNSAKNLADVFLLDDWKSLMQLNQYTAYARVNGKKGMLPVFSFKGFYFKDENGNIKKNYVHEF
jgi:hypothetical protein